MYKSCVRGTMFYSSECWALRQENKKLLERSEKAMPLCMSNINKEQCVNKNSLLSRMKLKSLDSVLSCSRLCWFEHVRWSELYTGQIFDLEVEGNRSRGRPKMCLFDTIKDDLRQWNHQNEVCQKLREWRKWLKTARRMHARTHARTHAPTHACTHARTHAHTHTHTHTHRGHVPWR